MVMATYYLKYQSLCLVFLFIFVSSLYAQKPTTTNVKVSYLQLPLKPLESQIKTYKSELKMESMSEETDIEQLLRQYLKITGYDVNQDNPDILIKAEFGEFRIDKKLISDKVLNVNAGKNMTGYYFETTINYPVTLEIKNNNGTILFNKVIVHDDKTINDNFGKWTYSKGELERSWSSQKEEIMIEVKDMLDKKALREIKNTLDSNFGTIKVTRKIKIFGAKGKKIDYSDLDNALSHVDNAFEMISSGSQQQEIDIELEKAKHIWQTAISEVSSDKKARINNSIACMLYYNMAIADWWMKNFESAYTNMETATSLSNVADNLSGGDIKLIKEVWSGIKDYEARLIANNE